MAVYGLNRESQEPKDQIWKSRETKFEIEFWMGFNLHKKFKSNWVHLENF